MKALLPRASRERAKRHEGEDVGKVAKCALGGAIATLALGIVATWSACFLACVAFDGPEEGIGEALLSSIEVFASLFDGGREWPAASLCFALVAICSAIGGGAVTLLSELYTSIDADEGYDAPRCTDQAREEPARSSGFGEMGKGGKGYDVEKQTLKFKG